MNRYLITSRDFYGDIPVVFSQTLHNQLKKYTPEYVLYRDKLNKNYDIQAAYFIKVCSEYKETKSFLHQHVDLAKELNATGVHLTSSQFDEIEKAIKRENNRKFTLNIKFNPLEGKYHKTRCTGCLNFYDPEDATSMKWRCPSCGKPIKKGVDYRIHELADLPENNHPEHRPKCIHIIPLSEIIALAYSISNAWSEKVQKIWKDFINSFGNEINTDPFNYTRSV